MNLEEEIKLAVEKTLPRQVGDSLRKRLEQADNLENVNEALKTGLEQSKALVETLRSEISRLEQLKMVVTELNARERALDQREINLDITLLKAELEAEKSKSEFGFNVALGLVRNTQFRRNLSDSQTLPAMPGPNGYDIPQNTFQTSTETKSAE
jgi:uncharacterized protein with von Willebrand factor type A (vWA) domain